MNTLGWVALFLSAVSTLTAVLTLRRLFVVDKKQDITAKLAAIQTNQDTARSRHEELAQSVRDLQADMQRMTDRLDRHEQRDAELHADIKGMFAEIKQMVSEFVQKAFMKPEHPDQWPATVQQLRHEKASQKQITDDLRSRVAKLEEQ